MVKQLTEATATKQTTVKSKTIGKNFIFYLGNCEDCESNDEWVVFYTPAGSAFSLSILKWDQKGRDVRNSWDLRATLIGIGNPTTTRTRESTTTNYTQHLQ
jgi:hypothetical protein